MASAMRLVVTCSCQAPDLKTRRAALPSATRLDDLIVQRSASSATVPRPRVAAAAGWRGEQRRWKVAEHGGVVRPCWIFGPRARFRGVLAAKPSRWHGNIMHALHRPHHPARLQQKKPGEQARRGTKNRHPNQVGVRAIWSRLGANVKVASLHRIRSFWLPQAPRWHG